MKRINDYMDVKVAVAASAGSVAPMVATKIDGNGFSRARFVFTLGNGAATTAGLSASAGIWTASTSGGTYTQNASALLAAITSGVISATAVTMVIDLPISTGTRWMQVSAASITSTGVPHSCIVELYNGISNPPTSSAQQLVTV